MIAALKYLCLFQMNYAGNQGGKKKKSKMEKLMAPIWLLVCYIWKMTSGYFLGVRKQRVSLYGRKGFLEKSLPRKQGCV